MVQGYSFALLTLLIVISGNDAQYIFFLSMKWQSVQVILADADVISLIYSHVYLRWLVAQASSWELLLSSPSFIFLPEKYKSKKKKKNENKWNNHIKNCKLV